MKTGLVVTLGFCAVIAGAYILDGWSMVKFFAGFLLLIGWGFRTISIYGVPWRERDTMKTENDGAGARKPKLEDICIHCEQTYGRHNAKSDSCPGTNTFKVAERGEVGSVPETRYRIICPVNPDHRAMVDSKRTPIKRCLFCDAKATIVIVGSVGQGEPRRIFCAMCGDTGLQNGVKCPQPGCRKTNGLSPFEAQPEAGAVTQYRKKPVVIKANQWFRDGDHPQVTTPPPHCSPTSDIRCEKCGNPSGEHGWIQTLEGGSDGAQLVCPGDWIITGIKGEFYPCKPDIFAKTYELASVAPSVEEPARRVIEAWDSAETFGPLVEIEIEQSAAIEALRAALERKQSQ